MTQYHLLLNSTQRYTVHLPIHSTITVLQNAYCFIVQFGIQCTYFYYNTLIVLQYNYWFTENILFYSTLMFTIHSFFNITFTVLQYTYYFTVNLPIYSTLTVLQSTFYYTVHITVIRYTFCYLVHLLFHSTITALKYITVLQCYTLHLLLYSTLTVIQYILL